MNMIVEEVKVLKLLDLDFGSLRQLLTSVLFLWFQNYLCGTWMLFLLCMYVLYTLLISPSFVLMYCIRKEYHRLWKSLLTSL